MFLWRVGSKSLKRLFKKALRDILSDKHRAIVSLLAIIIGMSSFGIVTFCYSIVSREIPKLYRHTNPVSASIFVDNVDDNLIELTKNFEGIEGFELKANYSFRVQSGQALKTLDLFAAEDFGNAKYNKVSLTDGTFTMGHDEALIEKDALNVANASLGDSVSVILSDDNIRQLRLVGSVNDVSVHPASMHNLVYLYVSFDTLQTLGLTPNKIDYVITGDHYSKENIEAISNQYVKMLEYHGYAVKRLDIASNPGESIHMSEYAGSLLLLQIFSVVAFLFSCMIMSNLLSSILNNQIKQIGILKAIGGKTRQIFAAYMMAVLVLVSISAAISIPAVALISGGLSKAMLALGNMVPMSTGVPGYYYALFCAVILIVPIIVACSPLRIGIRITVKEAISDYGIQAKGVGNREISGTFFTRPVLLSLRNATQRKSRLALNITLLALGGAMFVTVVTMMISVQATLDRNLASLNYDYQITVSQKLTDGELENAINGIEEVKAFERWEGGIVQLQQENGQIGSSYSVISPPNDTDMMTPDMMTGHWIDQVDTDSVVVSHKFLTTESGYAMGKPILLQINNTVKQFIIAGVLKDFSVAGIYMNRNTFEQFFPREQTQSSIKLSTVSTIRNKRAFYTSLDKQFENSGVFVIQSESKEEMNDILKSHFLVTLQTFLLIILLIVAVSAFGLAATMNAQTAERTKEIGIMKAIGANKRQIMRIVTTESIFIAIASWVISGVVGFGTSFAGLSIFGTNILKAPLVFQIFPYLLSFIIWLGLVIFVGYMASRKTAKRAAKMSIKQALVLEH